MPPKLTFDKSLSSANRLNWIDSIAPRLQIHYEYESHGDVEKRRTRTRTAPFAIYCTNHG